MARSQVVPRAAGKKPILESVPRKSYLQRLWKDVKAHRAMIVMFIPGVMFLVLFSYIPMYGIQLAFRRWTAEGGITGSPWVGLDNFRRFFSSVYSVRIIRNSILLSVLGLAFGFPVPIIFALMLNEVAQRWFKRVVQTISYFPYFVSVLVIATMAKMLFSIDPVTGVVNQILGKLFDLEPIYFFGKSEFFRPIYILTGIWQGMGFSAIIYLAALAGVDVAQYESAIIDGANRFQLIRYVTLPALIPTMVIVLILSLSGMLRNSLEKIMIMYGPVLYETADVIETFVYRRGIAGEAGRPDYAFATAVGLFQSLIGLLLIIVANAIARRVGETSLW